MHDFYYQTLLSDASKFAPRPGTRFLELCDPGDGSPVQCHEGQLRETEISPWLHKVMPEAIQAPEAGGTSSCTRLRLLIGSPEHHHSDADVLPLPWSVDAFEQIRKVWSLPAELLRMMLSTLPIRTSFSSNNRGGKPEHVVLLCRGGRSRDWNYCLALTHDLSNGTTCALVQGLEAHEIDVLIDCLKSSREHVGKPMLLPLYLTELKTHFFAVLLEKRALSLEEIEYETGMSHGFSEDPRRNPALNASRKRDLAKLEFEPITQKLTGLTGTLAFCDLTFEANRLDLELVIATARKISAAQTSSRKRTNLDETRPDPDQRANYLKGLLAGAQAHRGVLLERTKAQVQTVYSMIGQRDNKLNIQTAIAARRDSNAMRIIAAVTLIFLPGTFLATLFSTTFFNFQKNTQSVVSSWVWLFFALTAFLTLVVLLGWYYISKKQDRTMLQSLNIGSAGRPPVQDDEEATITFEKQNWGLPESGAELSTRSLERSATSIGRITSMGAYTKNDLDARRAMSGIPTEWHN